MIRKTYHLKVLIAAATVSTVLVVAVEWPRVRNWYSPPSAGLPAADQIVEMRGVVWAAGSRGQLETDVPEFVVPESVAGRLWLRFQPAVPVTDPPAARQDPLGQLTVTTRDGRVTRVKFYETGTDELIFTTDLKHFFRSEPRDERGFPLGGGLLLGGTLRHASVLAEVPDGSPRSRPAPRGHLPTPQ
jgi:hypothetical protein